MTTTNNEGAGQAFPCPPTHIPGRGVTEGDYGLTKREWLAGLAMQGFLANPGTGTTTAPAEIADTIALAARTMADALLEELARND